MDTNVPADTTTRDIALSLIDPSATNPRKTFDEEALRELGASMASPVGQIHPALVRPRGDRFELVAGERRWRAAGLAGLATLRCEVREIPDDLVREMQLVENAGREDVHPLEEAIALDTIVREDKRSPQYLADRLGRPVRWVQRRLSLMGLTEEGRTWLRDGRLPIAHAQQLAVLDAATQGRVLSRFAHASLPSSREFARVIGDELHGLDAAPFDLADAKLPGHGVCGKCPHRSDTQGDLFTGAATHAMCLDAACWDGKVAAVWERAVKAAPKKHLTVLSEPGQVFGYGDNLRWDSEFQKTPASEGAKPIALARTTSGHVVELYAKGVAKGAGETRGDDEDEQDDDAEPMATRRPSKWDFERAAADAARELRRARLLDIVGRGPDSVVLVLRNALASQVYQCGGDGLRALLRLRGEEGTEDFTEEALVDSVPAEDLAQLLGVLLADDHLEGIESAAEDEERAPFEAELLALMKDEAPAVEPPPVLVRLWLPARPFGELTVDGRAMYDHADVDHDLTWETRGAWVTAVMPQRVAAIVRTLAAEDSFTVHEGEEAPAEPVVTTELRVKRSVWQTHCSGLRDTSTGALHKQWEPDGDDRVVQVERGNAVIAQVVEYCRAHKVPLRMNGTDLMVAPEPTTKGKKSAAATEPPPRVTRVDDDALAVLSTMGVDGTVARITEGTLDRKLYERTSKVLEALGGTWSKKLKGHVFAEDPRDALDGVILTGEVARARDVLGWFPTPLELVRQLLTLAGGADVGTTLLEPSAGEGAIVGAAIMRGYTVTAVEIDPGRHRTLVGRYQSGNRKSDGTFGGLAADVCGDFLRWDPDERFDRVVMNPPFARGQDVEHVTAAFRLLKPDGRLVAVMSAGVAFREDRKTVAFRELVREAGGTITANEEGAFKASGTSVRTVTVVMDRKAVA